MRMKKHRCVLILSFGTADNEIPITGTALYSVKTTFYFKVLTCTWMNLGKQ